MLLDGLLGSLVTNLVSVIAFSGAPGAGEGEVQEDDAKYHPFWVPGTSEAVVYERFVFSDPKKTRITGFDLFSSLTTDL